MKIKYLLVLSFALFCFSCKKEADSIIQSPAHNTSASNPTSYLLKSQIWSGPTTNGQGFFYKYNSDNLVTRIARHQWGTSSSNGGPMQRWDDTTYFYFEYTNGLCTKMKFDTGSSGPYFAYEYNLQNLPVKRIAYFNNNTIEGYSFYKYDINGNLIQKIDSAYNKVNFRYDFTYDQNNNLTSVTKNEVYQIPYKKTKYEYLNHDNKVNFIKAVNGLPVTFDWDNNFHSYSSSAPNNYCASNHYLTVDVNKPFGSPDYYNYSYEYNDEGLPTKMWYTVWQVDFEYEKIK